MLWYRCLSVSPVCPVYNVGVMWPNGWTDQDATWHGGRPRPWPHCVRWGPSSPPQRDTPPQFSAHICCGQMAGWIKMPLGMEVGLGPGHIVLHGDSVLRKGAQPPPQFSAHGYCGQTVAHLSFCVALVEELMRQFTVQ